jgi:hypothetical protein
MAEIKAIHPKNVNDSLFKLIGGMALFLNKCRHTLLGYRNPRTFSADQIQRSVEYDFKIVGRWQGYLAEYLGDPSPLKGKRILELGPGPDLGNGLILLAAGAEQYHAIDVHDLAHSAADEFYKELFSRLDSEYGHSIDLTALRSELDLAVKGKSGRLNYVCRKDFDISVFRGSGVDLVLSWATCEHFDRLEETISQVSDVVTAGAVFAAHVDLKTHTRWLRDRDPLNIYRYSDTVYNLFHFTGSPNRARPHRYKDLLQKHGWKNVQVLPRTVLPENYVEKINGSLDRQFRDPVNQMGYLSIVILATKASSVA